MNELYILKNLLFQHLTHVCDFTNKKKLVFFVKLVINKAAHTKTCYPGNFPIFEYTNPPLPKCMYNIILR